MRKMAEEQNKDLGLTTNRLEALTDGIFAIAMTILVLNLTIPDAGQAVTGAALHNLLFNQADKFFNYIRSFLLLAIVWIILHQQFHSIVRTDWKHIWTNIVLLMFVVLIPFSTSLSGDFPNDWMTEFIFGLNLFVVGVLLQLHWHYATSGHRLVRANLSKEKINVSKKRGTVTPAIALLAMVISVFSPENASYVYILIPVVLLLPFFHDKKLRD